MTAILFVYVHVFVNHKMWEIFCLLLAGCLSTKKKQWKKHIGNTFPCICSRSGTDFSDTIPNFSSPDGAKRVSFQINVPYKKIITVPQRLQKTLDSSKTVPRIQINQFIFPLERAFSPQFISTFRSISATCADLPRKK